MKKKSYVYVLESLDDRTRVFESFEAAKAVFDDIVTWDKENNKLSIAYDEAGYFRAYTIYEDDEGNEYLDEKIEISISKLEVEG